jgi:plastocyanin
MATAQEAPATAPARRPTESPQQLPAPTTAPLSRPQRAEAKRSQQTSLTFDQFMQGQLPLLVAVALIFSAIAYAAIANLPVRAANGSSGATAGAAQAGGAVSDAPITAFSSEMAAQQIPVAVDQSGALKWDRTTYEAQAGDVTFVITNKSSSTHNFAVEGPNVTAQGPNFGSNTTTTYTLKGLKPGTYQIACNFPGHKAAGMVATLIVK